MIDVCILEHQVLQYPLGEATLTHAEVLTYASLVQNFHSSALELEKPQGAGRQYLRISSHAFSTLLFYLKKA